MITEGVVESAKNQYYITQDATKELIGDLQRALEEAKDHGMHCPVSLYVEQRDGKRYPVTMLVRQK